MPRRLRAMRSKNRSKEVKFERFHKNVNGILASKLCDGGAYHLFFSICLINMMSMSKDDYEGHRRQDGSSSSPIKHL